MSVSLRMTLSQRICRKFLLQTDSTLYIRLIVFPFLCYSLQYTLSLQFAVILVIISLVGYILFCTGYWNRIVLCGKVVAESLHRDSLLLDEVLICVSDQCCISTFVLQA